MKKAFTLVELLVVIAILGILSAVLIGSFSGGTESARNAKCLTNMKNLASACQTYGMASGGYPLAGSVEIVSVNSAAVRKAGSSSNAMRYSEIPGWLSWASQGQYEGTVTSSKGGLGWYASTYTQDDEVRQHCYTNGVLWKYISGTRELFQCPAHVRKFESTPPAWSYVMNAYFQWAGQNASPRTGTPAVKYGSLKRADRILLFAEMPYIEGMGAKVEHTAAAGPDCDCVLQYQDGECIGFNHGTGKKSKFAHVVFADGHAEKLAWPRNGMTESQLRDLTEWLCTGQDVSFNGQKYEELR